LYENCSSVSLIAVSSGFAARFAFLLLSQISIITSGNFSFSINLVGPWNAYDSVRTFSTCTIKEFTTKDGGLPDFPMGEQGKDHDIGLSVSETLSRTRNSGSGGSSNQVDLGVSSALAVSRRPNSWKGRLHRIMTRLAEFQADENPDERNLLKLRQENFSSE
jgi:hypothetical protein